MTKNKISFLNRYSSFIPFILISAFTFLIYEQTYAPNGIVFANQDFIGFLILIVTNLSLIFFTIFVQQYDKKQTKIRYFLLYGLLIIVALNVLNLIIMPMDQVINVTTGEGDITQMVLNISVADKFRSLMLLFVSASYIYLMAIVLPRKFFFRGFVLLISHALILYGLGIALYSFIVEFDVYLDLVRIGYGNASIPVPLGPYDNRNTFASFLLTAFMFAVFMYFFYKTRKRRFFYIFLTLPLIVAIYFTFSKTNMILSVLTFLFVFFRHVFLLLKKHRVRFIIELGLFFVFVAVVAIFRFTPALSTTLIARALTNLIPLDLLEIGERTLHARVELWRLAYDLISSRSRSLFLGDGIYINRLLFHERIVLENPSWSSSGYGNYHSGYFEIFHAFGLVGFLVYLAILLTLFIKILVFMKKMPAPGYFLMLSFIVLVTRGSVESIMLLTFKTESILASFALIMPFFYFSNLKQEYKARTMALIKQVSN